MRFIATKDGYLSDVCMHVKEGQVVEFPEGREPKIDLNDPYNWLVPEETFKPQAVLPTVGARPVVSEQKPKAHEFEVVRPDYDQNMDVIKQAEAVQDGGLVSPVVEPLVSQPAVVQTTEQAPAVAAPVEAPALPAIPAAPETNAAQQGSGNQDVL